MNKKFIFIIGTFLALSAGATTRAATAADACSAVPDNYTGQAVCISSYNTCIGNRPGDTSGCASTAQQIGQSTYNTGACQAQNPNNDCTPVPQQDIDFINTPHVVSSPVQTPNTSAAPRSNGTLPYAPLEPLPGLNGLQNGNANFAALLQGLFTLLISLGALVAVGALVVGGITYMVSDIVDRKHEAKSRMYAAVWGLLLLLASFLILNTINPQLVNFSGILNPIGGGNSSPQILQNAPQTTPAPAQQNSAETDCKATGPSCSLTPTPDGSTQCTCGA